MGKASAPCSSHMDDLLSLARSIAYKGSYSASWPQASLRFISRLPKRKFPTAFRFALQDCPSGLPFRNALQDCTSGLPFRSVFRDRCPSRLRFKFALQDCPSGLSFRIALQSWPSRLSFGIALQDCLSGSPFQLRFGRSQKGSVSGSEKYHLSKYIFLRVPPPPPSTMLKRIGPP